MKKRNVLGVGISTGEYEAFPERIAELSREKKGGYVCVVNVHMLVEAHDDPGFARVVNGARIATPDGKPVSVMLKMLYGEDQDRVAGMDLFPDLVRGAEKEGLSVFFYGSDGETLKRVMLRLEKDFPSLKVAGHLSPPLMHTGEEIPDDHIELINQCGPDLVFVILGCPKQEKVMAEMSGRVRGLLIGIGGAVNVFAGKMKRAPVWMQRLSLEWLFRLLQEPGRLWKRYLYTNSKFILLASAELVKRRILKRGDKV